MRKVVVFLAAYSMLMGAVFAQNWQEVTVSGITLRWATTSATELSVELSAETTGWVAVGFDPVMGMQDANIIIGYHSSGSTEIRDDYGIAPTGHDADTNIGGTSDFSLDGGSESGGITEIKFTIPLDSGDQYDKVLVPGNSYLVMLAHGANGADDFTSPHAARDTTTIEITTLALDSKTWGTVKADF